MKLNDRANEYPDNVEPPVAMNYKLTYQSGFEDGYEKGYGVGLGNTCSVFQQTIDHLMSDEDSHSPSSDSAETVTRRIHMKLHEFFAEMYLSGRILQGKPVTEDHRSRAYDLFRRVVEQESSDSNTKECVYDHAKLRQQAAKYCPDCAADLKSASSQVNTECPCSCHELDPMPSCGRCGCKAEDKAVDAE